MATRTAPRQMDRPFLAWQDSYSVGHPGLDAQHRHLVALVNEIHSVESGASEPDRLQSLLHSFELEAINHYRVENSIMQLLGEQAQKLRASAQSKPFSQALINEHYAEHARSLVALESIIHPSDTKRAHGNYCVLLKAWFAEHANIDDVDLKTLFAARSQEG